MSLAGRSAALSNALARGAIRKGAFSVISGISSAAIAAIFQSLFGPLTGAETQELIDLSQSAADAGELFSSDPFDEDEALSVTPVVPESFLDDDEGSRFRWGVEVDWSIPDSDVSDTWLIELTDSVLLTPGEIAQAIEMEMERRRNITDSPSFADIDPGQIEINAITVRYAERVF